MHLLSCISLYSAWPGVEPSRAHDGVCQNNVCTVATITTADKSQATVFVSLRGQRKVAGWLQAGPPSGHAPHCHGVSGGLPILVAPTRKYCCTKLAGCKIVSTSLEKYSCLLLLSCHLVRFGLSLQAEL